MSDLDPEDLARAFGQIPVFREMQRLLLSQAGPVNWEIARQLARAVAQAGGPGAVPGPPEHDAFLETSRAAELFVAQRTGLEAPAAVTRLDLMDRAAWADANLDGFRPLIERLAVRLRGRFQEGSVPALPMQGIFDAIGPFLLGVQVGFLVGYLSRRVLGQYDVCVPRGEPGRLYFVYPNILEVERELQVEPQQFRMWLSLHELTHHLELTAVPWTRAHFVGLVERFIDAAEVDSGEVAARLQSLADPDRLAHLLEHPEELLPMLMTPAQESAVSEIQGFMSVLEGYAEWAVAEVGPGLLPEHGKIREGIARRRAERSSAERLLEALFGVDLKLEQYRAGERFVREVAASGHAGRLWEGAANLPTMDEIREPARWLGRVAFS